MQEAQRDRHRSEIEAIKLEMPSREVQKKLAVSSRSFKEAGRISDQMRAREEERRALEEQFEELQSSLLISCEVLVAIKQAEEAAHAELLRIDTDCVMEGVDVVALRAMPQERGRCWRWRSETCKLRRCTLQPNTN